MTDDVAAYLSKSPADTRDRLNMIRQIVSNRCPRAVEGMSYGLLGYKLNGHPLVYFGGFQAHIGLYATPEGTETFAKEFASFKQGKGSVQFPLSEPLPVELIERVIAHRVELVGNLLPMIGRPATNALTAVGVTTLTQVAEYSESELLAMHGVGPKAIRLIRACGVRLRDDPADAAVTR
ncbi:MAG: DUF1801 domain-containing protein [Scrofimicrobium sp.]